MAFKRSKKDLHKFLIFIFLIFIKNIIRDFSYQYYEIVTESNRNIALFYTFFYAFDWIFFWAYLNRTFSHQWRVASMAFITIVFTSFPYFISLPVFGYDHDNLILKGVFHFLPFAIFLGFKQTPRRYFLPIMMAFIPLISLHIAEGIKGDYSLLSYILSNDALNISLGSDIYINLGYTLAQTALWAAVCILFYEVNHQFFAWNSWRLNVEIPMTKGYMILVFIVFKIIIYWLAYSIVIGVLSKNLLPLFSNRVGLILNMAGFLSLLVLSVLYYRKYITLYFYDKCGHSNWLYPFLFIPFLDIPAFIVLMVLPARLITRFFSKNYSKEIFVSIICAVLVFYAGYKYFTQIMPIPEANPDVKLILLLTQVALPIISAIGLALSLKYTSVYKGLMIIFVILLPIYYLFVINHALENWLNIKQLVRLVSVYTNIGIVIAFLYPVLNFKSFLRIK